MIGRDGLVCSFCHKRDTAVAKLVAGPRMFFFGSRVFICDECVAVATRLMQGEAADQGLREPHEEGIWRKLWDRLTRARPSERRAAAL
jgi:ATP-dependent protease Clp ATPase subunit